MTKSQIALAAVQALRDAYPDTVCSLRSGSPLQLLIATRLSAQCTDARVNLVTPALFARFPDVDAFCAGSEDEIAAYIRSCGLYKTKAHDIYAMCCALRDRFGVQVPHTMAALTSLPGVGRKTANLILGDVFGQPAVVADTHCIRISNRLGLCATKDPGKVETALRALLPPEESNAFCHRLVLHGRAVCTARGPHCARCFFAGFCRRVVGAAK